METRTQITYIPTADIAPHPDNPRQDLGDLSELADSIRVNGIMENLLVVRNPDAVRRVAHPDGTSFEEPTGQPPYRVVIGHRRLAAAKLAKVTKVPCVVRVMAPDEQIAVMLAENMQRAELTPYEEGRGFQQLSLDMGKSVKEIGRMTGFGETTIRSRLKIAQLDGKKVNAGLERGATLDDFAKLNEIKSAATRDSVLTKIGTADFNNALKSAVHAEETQETLKRLIAEADAFATRIDDTAGYEFVKSHSAGSVHNSVARPDDADKTAYFYTVYAPFVSLYRKAPEKSDAQKAREESERRSAELAERLSEMASRHYELRRDFVAGFHSVVTYSEKIAKFAAEVLMTPRYSMISYRLLAELYGMDKRINFNDDYLKIRAQILEAACGAEMQTSRSSMVVVRLLLRTAYAFCGDSRNNTYYERQWSSGVTTCVHRENAALNAIYDFLTELGYRMSEEEERMRDGTHPIFTEESDAPDVAKESGTAAESDATEGKIYVDNHGWKYKVMGGIGGGTFKARRQKSDRTGVTGWRGVATLEWRPTFAEAQDDLDRMASAKGWRVWEESDAADNRNDDGV